MHFQFCHASKIRSIGTPCTLLGATLYRWGKHKYVCNPAGADTRNRHPCGLLFRQQELFFHCCFRYNQTTMESSWEKPAIIDTYFKKPALAKSLLYLGETPKSGETTRSSIVNGFESSSTRQLQ